VNHDAINRINTLILKERKRQDELWGWPNAGLAGANNELKMAILAEEVGEVAHAILENDIPKLHE
jgi:NTP pyrophosphatase (non-canonical NTP hydrolase)